MFVFADELRGGEAQASGGGIDREGEENVTRVVQDGMLDESCTCID